MIEAIRFVVPWALLAACLVCAMRWRLFLLGVPFLMFMGSSVFFDTMRVFHIPGRLDESVLLLLWLIVVWVFATGKIFPRKPVKEQQGASLISRRPFLPEELAVVAFGGLVVGHIVADAVRGGDFAGAAGRGLGMLSMVVGYFFLRDIVEHASRRETVLFLGAVVLANTIATALFILHQGLNVGIYSDAANVTTVYEGQVITRTFTFAPPFVLLTAAYVLARRRWTLGWVGVLMIATAGVWVSLTRSVLLIIMAVLLLALLARQLKTPSASKLLRRVLGIAGLGLVLVWGFTTFLHAQSGYFVERLAGLQSNALSAEDNSMLTRLDFFHSTIDVMDAGDAALGAGFSASNAAAAAQVEAWGADSAWILIVYRLGIAGVLLVAVMCIGFGVRAFRLFMRGTGDGEYLGLVFFLTIVSTLLLSFVSRTFVEPLVLPMGLWLFAFVGADARRSDSRDTAAVPAPNGGIM